MTEYTPACRISEKYSWIKCENPCLAMDPDRFCLIHSQQENKDRDGRFTEIVEKKLAEGDFNFSSFFFPDNADFSAQIFTKSTDFTDAIFNQANFEGAFFTANVSFRQAYFGGGVNFSLANFQGEADFYECTFLKGVNFCGARFNGSAKFFNLNLLGDAGFIGTRISTKGSIIFRSINQYQKIKWLPFLADFGYLRQEKGGVLLFQNLNLAKVTFSDADLMGMEFENVEWASLWGRAAIYDEIRLHKKKWANIAYFMKYGRIRHLRKWRDSEIDEGGNLYSNFSKVERIYRQLKINFEEKRDFKQVGDFHYGEMEMHRRGSLWRQWFPFSWHNLYRTLSGYGERPLRALIWLLLLIPAWSGLVWLLGFSKTGAQYQINYVDSFLFVFEKATLQRPAWPTSINWLGKLFSTLGVLLIPGQAALFLLALRNRLGRRR